MQKKHKIWSWINRVKLSVFPPYSEIAYALQTEQGFIRGLLKISI